MRDETRLVAEEVRFHIYTISWMGCGVQEKEEGPRMTPDNTILIRVLLNMPKMCSSLLHAD